MAGQTPAKATGSEQQQTTSSGPPTAATSTPPTKPFSYKKVIALLAGKMNKAAFETDFCRIPSQNPESHFLEKFQEIKEKAEMEESLVIVYYGGHGGMHEDEEGKCSFELSHLGPPNPSMYPYPPQNQGLPPDKGPILAKFVSSLRWAFVETALKSAQSDVLVLIDACDASAALAQFKPDGSSRRMDFITACGGYDGTTPIPGNYTYANRLGCTFTEMLIYVLETKVDAKEMFTAANLHVSIMQRMMEVKLATGQAPPTPFHISVGAMNGLPSPSVLLKVMGEQNAMCSETDAEQIVRLDGRSRN